jgi:hypothetical protein
MINIKFEYNIYSERHIDAYANNIFITSINLYYMEKSRVYKWRVDDNKFFSSKYFKENELEKAKAYVEKHFTKWIMDFVEVVE